MTDTIKKNSLETEIINRVKELIQCAEIKELKEVISDCVLDRLRVSRDVGAFSIDYLEEMFCQLFELMKLLDSIQDYQAIERYINNSKLN